MRGENRSDTHFVVCISLAIRVWLAALLHQAIGLWLQAEGKAGA
jgi:hypothetical protein